MFQTAYDNYYCKELNKLDLFSGFTRYILYQNGDHSF